MSVPSDLVDRVLALPERDRARLAHQLLASLDPAPQDEDDEAWLAEILRRADEVRAGETPGVSWDEIHAEAKAKLCASPTPSCS